MRWILVAGLLLAAACGTDGSPTEPTTEPTPTGVSVTHAAAGTIFIGHEVQFRATVTLSDGSTEAASEVTWTSDAPEVATVSTAGLVTAVAAGEATVSAEVAGGRGGYLRLRVYPEFQGSWAGRGMLTECTATGDSIWSLLCASFLDGDPAERRGEAALELTQSEAEVGGVVDLGADRRLEVNSGEVSIDGTLRLTFDATTLAIEGAELDVEVLSWETRADTPGNMTGGFQFVYSWALSTGAAVVDVVFEEVTRTAGTGG
jgi:hypothetical protein